MKLRSSILIFFAIGLLYIGTTYPHVDEAERESMILHTFFSILDEVHFNPQQINDEFSKESFTEFLGYIDHGKRFLTQEDVSALQSYELLIDDQIKARSLDFFDATMTKLDAGFQKAETYYNEIIAEDLPIDYTTSIQLDGDKKERAKDDAELKEYWRKSIIYDYISDVYELQENNEDLIKAQKDNENKDGEEEDNTEDVDGVDDGDEKILTQEDIYTKAKEDVSERWGDWFERMGKLRRSDRFESYLNTFAHLFDPHSEFYNPKEKQDFDINMGGKLEGIGARLSPGGDYIKVVDIIPGGPAWKGKELEVDDKIMEVTQAGGEPLDLFGWRVDDAVVHIRGKKGTVVSLKIKKKDNSVTTISIERDEVIIDESFARSVIMDIPGEVENVGYIKLPKFYSSFERKGGNSCAEDIKVELEKLKAQNVSGIVLDLRYNGGGSLNDVVNMSGLFIEEGPIVQVKPRGKRPFVYNDKDAGITWDGPLVVMVNSYSASASEILVAALQDYNRAVIVGSTSTFGKGTVQRFFDLDRAVSGKSEYKPLGAIKLTMQKFFRVNGGSTQLKGVVPDIIFPDRFSHIEAGEKEYEHAMEWSEIEPVTYAQNVYHIKNMDELKKSSETRIAANPQFDLIKDNAIRIKREKDMSEYPLNVEDFSALMKKRKVELEKYKDLMSDSLEYLKIKNIEADLEYISEDESRVARNEDWIKGLHKDIYIEETLYVLRDMISTNSDQTMVKEIIKK